MFDTAAVIDLGSNSVRLTVADQDRVVFRQREYVRLSERMGKDNVLKEGPIQRTIDALMEMKNTIRDNHIETVYTVATEAVRRAVNQNAFLERVHYETGLIFSVLSGEQEAYYDYLGVRYAMDVRDCVILDTGGGSTEFVLVKNGEFAGWGHIPFGAVILTEQFRTLEEAEMAVRREIKELSWLEQAQNLDVVGLGGSIRAVGQNSKEYLTCEEVQEFYSRVREMNVEQRAKLKGVSPNRADIFAGGLVPLTVFMKEASARGLRFSDTSLREGILYEHFYNS